MKNPGRFARRASIAVCLTILVCLLVSYASLLAAGKLRIQQSDLLVYYSASHLVLLGHGSAVYTLGALKAVEASALHSLLLPRTEAVFLYPPFVALAFAPFAALGYVGTYGLWFVVNCLLLAVVLRALVGYLNLGGLDRVLFCVASVSFFPVVATLLQGQVSILLLASVMGVFLALRSGRDVLAGAALALVLLKPPYVLAFLLLLAAQRRWRALGSFAAAGIVLAILPVPFLGLSTDVDYLHLLRTAANWHTTSGGFSPHANENLWGFFRVLLPASMATVLQLVASMLALVGVAILGFRCRREIDVPFAAAAVAALLVNPHVLIHDLALLLIPAAIIVRHAEYGRKTAAALVIGGYSAALAAVPLSLTVHIQVLVLVMAAIIIWLFRQSSEPSETRRLQPIQVPVIAVEYEWETYKHPQRRETRSVLGALSPGPARSARSDRTGAALPGS